MERTRRETAHCIERRPIGSPGTPGDRQARAKGRRDPISTCTASLKTADKKRIGPKAFRLGSHILVTDPRPEKRP
jgi:hypothetical protein